MTSLVDVATRAGYTVISHNGLTVMEISGNGDWAKVEKACRRFILHTHFGHAYYHYTVVVRHGDGTRDLRDVGVNGVRFGYLPPVGHKEPRKYYGLGIRGARKEGHRFSSCMSVHGAKVYLGMYDTAREAGMARDKYVTDHNLLVTLNYPQEELVTA